MVQRKLPQKLSLLQPHQSFPHQHDLLTSPRGPKKMKKSGKPPPQTPNYMKPTTSSDARKEKPKIVAARKPTFKAAAAAAARKISGRAVVDAKRATCSSTLRDSRFPPYLSITPQGTSALKVCPYTYCSLNGHRHHHPPLPPLKSFLSSRRRSIKTQPLPQEEKRNDFFLEIYTPQDGQNQEVLVLNESDGSDMEWEIVPLQFHYDYEQEEDAVLDNKASSDIKDCSSSSSSFDEFVMDEASKESFDEEGFSSDAFSTTDDDDTDDLHSSLQVLIQHKQEEEKEDHGDYYVEEEENQDYEDDLNLEAIAVTRDEPSEGDCPIFSKDKEGEEEEEEISGEQKTQFTVKGKKLVEEDDEVGDFNPRGPNFLAVEPDPEAEKVDLKHQDLDDRRNSEEWMVDYALRQVVTKLGPARKRKVALLVEAFEKVMPLPLPTTKFDVHLSSHDSAFDQLWKIQACS